MTIDQKLDLMLKNQQAIMRALALVVASKSNHAVQELKRRIEATESALNTARS